MEPRKLSGIFLVLVFFLNACGPSKVSPKAPEITPPSKPEKGQATVTGQLIAKKTGEPLVRAIVRLAEVYREGEQGAYVLDEAFSPGAWTDDNGYFIFENILPMEYVLAYGPEPGLYKVITDPDDKPRIWNLEPDQILDFGVIKADLEP